MKILLAIFLLATAGTLAAAPAFPVKASTDGHYLTDAAGAPFFYHADTAWALPRNATLLAADEYFSQRAKDGFTAIHLHAVTKEVGPVKNVNGDEPFAPLDNILKPNEDYWRQVVLANRESMNAELGVFAAALVERSIYPENP